MQDILERRKLGARHGSSNVWRSEERASKRTGKATLNKPHQRRNQPECLAGRCRPAGARSAGSLINCVTRRKDSSLQRPPAWQATTQSR